MAEIEEVESIGHQFEAPLEESAPVIKIVKVKG